MLEKLTDTQLLEWFNTGIEILKKDLTLGELFFLIETEQSQLLIDTLSFSVDIEREKELFKIYCAALSGKTSKIRYNK